MKLIAAILAFLSSSIAMATDVPPTSMVYGAQHTDFFRNGTPGMLICKGSTDNNPYMAQCDPTTGGLLVSGSFSLSNDTNYGTVGSNTLRSAAQIGHATGAASFGAGTTGAQVLRVVLPTDQTAIPATESGTWTVQPGNTANTTPWLVNQYGKTYSTSVRNDYTSVNVTTGAWVQLIASTAAAINCITVFDSSGQTLEIGTGAAASETRVLIIPPGGLSGCIPLRIAASTRVSIKAISATASVGELDISGLN